MCVPNSKRYLFTDKKGSSAYDDEPQPINRRLSFRDTGAELSPASRTKTKTQLDLVPLKSPNSSLGPEKDVGSGLTVTGMSKVSANSRNVNADIGAMT